MSAAFAPFGNPDGSRADLDEVIQGFINFPEAGAWGGLATSDDDRTVRVLVGRKGSGKTVYLRRLQASASLDRSVYADVIQQSLPTTEAVIQFCQWFPDHLLSERWVELWSRALLRSLVSHLLYNPTLRGIGSEVSANFLDEYKPVLAATHTPVSVYSQVMELVNGRDTAHQMARFLEHPSWAQLEFQLGEVLRTAPPMFLYVDSVDEEFAHAPIYWLRCQLGLFHQTMRFLRDQRLGGRLHIVITIRDIVLARVFRSEHGTRYRGEPHIRVLNWDRDAIQYFIQHKLQLLPKEFFVDSFDPRRPIESWLGVDEIYNRALDHHEPIADYLLRHTRLLPRDIVTMGNLLCESVRRRNALHADEPLDRAVRETVHKAAVLFGNEQLEICANEMASTLMPAHAVTRRFHDAFVANDVYIRTLADKLKQIISLIGCDRFSSSDLEVAREYSGDVLADTTLDPFSILWRNGLVGYVDDHDPKAPATFFSEGSMSDFNLPLGRNGYVFHPCVTESVGLRVRGPRPVSAC